MVAPGRKVAFVFPGQGAQQVGMGREVASAFPVAREVFEEADEALGFSLSNLCWEGPEEELGLTANTQPALLATSTAIHRVLAAAGHQPAVVAGHSLGEYSSLVAAGALKLSHAVRLVRRRGELMQQAVPVGEGAMAAILGLDSKQVSEIAAAASRSPKTAGAHEEGEGEVCVVANLNAPAQTVIAGHKAAVERATELAKERGARRAVLLAVSAPFHSPLMEPARRAMEPLLAAADFQDPQVPVITNVDAQPVTTAEGARHALIRQIDRPVRWVESVAWMAREGEVETFVELGPGKVLSGLVRRIAPGIETVSLAEPEAIEEFISGG